MSMSWLRAPSNSSLLIWLHYILLSEEFCLAGDLKTLIV